MSKPIRLLATLTAVYAVGYGCSVITLAGLGGWYDLAPKPAWAAPIWLYVPLGTLLYAFIGYGLFALQEGSGGKRSAIILVCIHLALAAGWTWLFFWRHEMPQATLVASLEIPIWPFTLGLASRVAKPAARALWPQALWRAYAAAMTAAMWWLTSGPKKS